jgi:hypothetical protein
MAYPNSAGTPQYSGTFIPEIWSSKLVENLYDATVLSAISNTDYEGEIKKFGDTVNIRLAPSITLRPYQKGMTLTVERPESTKIQLLIDQGEYFNCIEDDIDKIQSDIDLMNEWSKDASERMKIAIDSKVLPGIVPSVSALNQGATAGRISQNINLGAATTPVQVTKTNVLDLIVDAGTVLDVANIPEAGRFMIIPAWMAGMIKKSDLKDASLTGDGSSVLRNGRLGNIDRFTLYTSHNLNSVIDSTFRCFDVLAGHKMGLTFATQMTEMESMRAESTFGTLIRGVQAYGYKVTKPEALARLYVRQ